MTGSHEDILQQVDQLKNITPSEDSTRRAISRSRSALVDRQPKTTPVETKRNARRITWRLALGGCAAAMIVMVACFAVLSRGSVAFAEVQQQIRQLRTVTYNFISGDKDNRITTRHVVSGTRERADWPGHTRIRVPDKKTVLLINHNDRTAVFSHDNSGEERKAIDIYGRLTTIAESSVKEIGKRTIDGKRAVGFEVLETGLPDEKPMLVWVDPSTRLPIKIVAGGNRVMCDFGFNTHVPEDLFELTVPDGYFVENRYEALQAAITLEESAQQGYTSLVTDPNRSPQQTIEAYLALAAAGKSELVQKLQRQPTSDDVRELDGFRELKLNRTYVTDTSAFGVTSAAISYRSERRAMVFTLKSFDGNWLIDDIDLESADGVQDELKRFLAEYPDAKELE